MYKVALLKQVTLSLSLFMNGSTQNGTVSVTKTLAVIRNRLYLCSAFGKQVCELEY